LFPGQERPEERRRGGKGEKEKWSRPLSSPVRTGAGQDRHSPKKDEKREERESGRKVRERVLVFLHRMFTTKTM
jgi:hypothetical protein